VLPGVQLGCLPNRAASCSVRAWRLEMAAVQGNPYAKQSRAQQSSQLRAGANLLILSPFF